MGFDVYGLKAKSKNGEYFRNNVWWWRPLALYVIENCNISDKKAEDWSFNNGGRVSAKKSLEIADKLDSLIASGETKKYERAYRKHQKSLPKVECEHCNGTGKRNDEYVKGKCNGCEGTGKRDNWELSYPFAEKNVKEFAIFCRESGGFEIC